MLGNLYIQANIFLLYIKRNQITFESKLQLQNMAKERVSGLTCNTLGYVCVCVRCIGCVSKLFIKTSNYGEERSFLKMQYVLLRFVS